MWLHFIIFKNAFHFHKKKKKVSMNGAGCIDVIRCCLNLIVMAPFCACLQGSLLHHLSSDWRMAGRWGEEVQAHPAVALSCYLILTG